MDGWRIPNVTGPGQAFHYTEATFFVVSAMALNVTGLQGWNAVFQKYIAKPLNIEESKCWFQGTASDKSDEKALAGGGLWCRTSEFATILQAILGKTLLTNADLYDEAESPNNTLDVRLIGKG